MPLICLRCFESRIFAGIETGRLRDVPEGGERPVERLARRERLVRSAVEVVGEAEPHPGGLLLRVPDRSHQDRQPLAAALDRELRRRGGLAALHGRLNLALVRLDLLREVRDRSVVAVDRDQQVMRMQHALRREALRDVAHLVALVDADHADVDHEQDEPDQQVHRRPGHDHDDPLPDRLPVVGARADLVRQLLGRVHAGDLHVAAGGDRADRVLGLAHLLLPDRGPKKSANFSTRMPTSFAAVKCPSSWSTIRIMKPSAASTQLKP